MHVMQTCTYMPMRVCVRAHAHTHIHTHNETEVSQPVSDPFAMLPSHHLLSLLYSVVTPKHP